MEFGEAWGNTPGLMDADADLPERPGNGTQG
jgi:hypothetical protein